MKKYKNIAVFIRGHKRMWDFIKHNIFESYDEIAENVDYYMAVWESSQLNLDKIKLDFAGRNLIACVTPPLYEIFNGPWKSQGWLPFNLLPYKKIREQSVKYDAVFDQRTDVVITQYACCEPFELKPMTLYSPEPMASSDDAPNRHTGITLTTYHPIPIRLIKDFGFMCDSETFDILTHRFAFFEDRTVPVENLLYNYCDKKKISFEYKHPLRHSIVRPITWDNPSIVHPIGSLINRKLFLGDKDLVLAPYWSSYDDWSKTSPSEKIAICDRHNIDVEDYIDKLSDGYEQVQ